MTSPGKDPPATAVWSNRMIFALWSAVKLDPSTLATSNTATSKENMSGVKGCTLKGSRMPWAWTASGVDSMANGS
eukprot:CAMPEP_0179206042 /NCGR_PEP_ID=MMETSP0796-20121207/102723_1 /TAXON_ID=73915 /ORGANISM="Pyrodinium bahamense, Strain pbaha01" /LENGTH=74 /DNA_ID=CAMNT_0020910935 /DNA_START=323 /DNA_END=543 /DNA_ORIENTATION=-